jgi:hypothetical protein
MPYKSLNPDQIVASTDVLYKRIQERFPNRGISKVCAELHQIAHATRERAEWIKKPHWLLRLGTVILLGVLIVMLGILFWEVEVEIGRLDLVQFLEAINNGVNDIILISAGMFFLFTLETRFKRQRALTALHELRALAHVIDMHQLTKDPERVQGRWVKTKSSPEHTMTVFELSRYLDYCSEMLSVIGKIAALYVQDFHDAPATAAVNEIEDLTNGLSRKIWQKIMILHTLESESRNGNFDKRDTLENEDQMFADSFVEVEGWSDAED